MRSPALKIGLQPVCQRILIMPVRRMHDFSCRLPYRNDIGILIQNLRYGTGCLHFMAFSRRIIQADGEYFSF